MPVPVVIAGVLKALAANGLGLLANAVMAKGKEVIEEKIGVKIPDDASELTGDKLMELKKAEMAHQEFLIEAGLRERAMEIDAEKHASSQVTARWQADMTSDSWLSKNIRPIGLAWVLLNLTGVLIADAFGVEFSVSTTSMLEGITAIIVGAYYVGRTVQHVTKTVKK